jgi:hypothetical protein
LCAEDHAKADIGHRRPYYRRWRLNHPLQSMCSILHLEVGLLSDRWSLSEIECTGKMLILNNFRNDSGIASELYHFGSANAHSSCNEEAATLGTLLSIFRLLTGRFFPGNGAQLSFL